MVVSGITHGTYFQLAFITKINLDGAGMKHHKILFTFKYIFYRNASIPDCNIDSDQWLTHQILENRESM